MLQHLKRMPGSLYSDKNGAGLQTSKVDGIIYKEVLHKWNRTERVYANQHIIIIET